MVFKIFDNIVFKKVIVVCTQSNDECYVIYIPRGTKKKLRMIVYDSTMV